LSPHEKPGIILAAFGSVYPQATATYEEIRQAYEREFPGQQIVLAYTSELMIRRLGELEGIRVPSLISALAKQHDNGLRKAVVQSLQIVPGEEFHRAAMLVAGLDRSGKLGFERLEMGKPLLADLEDCKKVLGLLPDLWEAANFHGGQNSRIVAERDMNDEAVLLVGHGTGQLADGLYSLMSELLREDLRMKNVFLGTLEGSPGILDVMRELEGCSAKRILLVPFLLVAGGHAGNDIAGDGPDSWRSLLKREGFEVEVHFSGLGESPKIVSIFLEHTRGALKRLEDG
jgi:sirohydrochlorin cobaltochelatase